MKLKSGNIQSIVQFIHRFYLHDDTIIIYFTRVKRKQEGEKVFYKPAIFYYKLAKYIKLIYNIRICNFLADGRIQLQRPRRTLWRTTTNFLEEYDEFKQVFDQRQFCDAMTSQCPSAIKSGFWENSQKSEVKV